MKNKYILKVILLLFFISMIGLFSSCIEETFPEGGSAVQKQVDEADGSAKALLNGALFFFNEFNGYGSGAGHDYGYSSYMIMRETMGNDSYNNGAYQYYSAFGAGNNIGPQKTMPVYYWWYYYNLLHRANLVIDLVDDNSLELKQYKGLALVIRSLVYLDLVRSYEYKKTGIADLDNEAESRGIYGLTIPIVEGSITEAEARENPRVPFYTMYEYINNNLTLAEEALKGYQRVSKNQPDLSVVYGMKARLWLEIASRFVKYPKDLDVMRQHVDLGVNTVQDCFKKAAEYARLGINTSAAKPLSKDEWYGGSGYKSGFNSINVSSWMWGSILKKENISSTWMNYNSYLSSETTYGISGLKYKTYRLIDRRFFEQISDADWRKTTWIAVEDAGKEPGDKYKTVLSDEDFKKLPAYASLKFKPAQGAVNDAYTGAVVDYPLMRVEELYFIEAEAIGGWKGIPAGISALEDFMNTYRYDTTAGVYKCLAETLEDFQKEVVTQRRIEFWGEGLSFFDFKRLELPIERGYPGTNASPSDRLNYDKGFCAPWFNIAISYYDTNKNPVLDSQKNPDPSQAIISWVED